MPIKVLLTDVRNAGGVEQDTGKCLASQVAAGDFDDGVRRADGTISASDRARDGGDNSSPLAGRSSTPSQYPNESSEPTVAPFSRSIAESNRTTVVLPCVPVTPITLICREGLPTRAWHSLPKATRLSSTTH